MAEPTAATPEGTPADAAPEVAADPNATAPNWADVKNEKLIANFEKLSEGLAKILGDKPTPENVEKARGIRAEQLSIKEEMDKRYQAQEALKADLAEIGNVDVTLPSFEEAPATIGEGAGIDETAPPVEDDKDRTPALVAASAGAPTPAQLAAARPAQPGTVAVPEKPARKPMAWIASAGAGNHAVAGNEIGLAQLGEAIMSHARQRGLKGEQRVYLASINEFDNSQGELLNDSPSRNDVLIQEAVDAWRNRRAGTSGVKTAAICEPLDILRNIPNPGRSQATPFSDDLPFRGAGRLGFQFTRAVTIASVTGGLALWSDTNQDAVTDEDDTWKPVYDVTCGTPLETKAEELTWGLRFEESTDLSSPERVADVLDALMTAERRRRESYLLRRFDQMSSGYTWATPDLGGMPDLVELLGRLLEKAAYTERLDLSGYVLWLPPAFETKLKLERLRRGDAAAARSEDVIAEMKSGLPEGVSITPLRDVSDNGDLDPDMDQATNVPNETVQGGGDDTLTAAGVAPTALVHDQCQTFRVRLADPSAFIAYSTGRADTGVLRSPELIRQNRSIMFGREWVGMAKHGSQPSFYADVTFLGLGRRAGTVDLHLEDCGS